MTAAQAGDQELFAALFDRHRRELLVHCYRMLGSFHEAEDLLQETFEKAWRGAGRVDTSSSPRAWLYRIATNACLDALRRRGRRRVLPFDVMDPVRPEGPMPAAADELWLEPFPDRLLSDVDPGETVVQRETIELAFLAALQHLPPRQRAAFIAQGRARLVGQGHRHPPRDQRGVGQERAAAGPRHHEGAPAPATGRLGRGGRAGRPGAGGAAALHRRPPARRRRGPGRGARRRRAGRLPADPPVERLAGRLHRGHQGACTSRGPPVRGHQRQPATGRGHLPPGTGEPVFRLVALEVLRIEGGRVTEIVDFDVPQLYAAFGLAPTLG